MENEFGFPTSPKYDTVASNLRIDQLQAGEKEQWTYSMERLMSCLLSGDALLAALSMSNEMVVCLGVQGGTGAAPPNVAPIKIDVRISMVSV